MSRPVLHLFCGKIGSGKSTLAARVAQAEGGVLVSEDGWLKALFGDEMQTGADFVRFSARLRAAMGPHVVALLRAGQSVALDFQANTLESRDWMRGLIEASGAAHVLHHIDLPDALCLERLAARNAGGGHEFAVTEAMFRRFSAAFVAPSEAEGFVIERHAEA